MKFLIGLLLIPSLGWSGTCEELPVAIEKCEPYECDISLAGNKLGSYKILGREGAKCRIDTEMKELGDICHLSDEALPHYSQMIKVNLSMTEIQSEMMKGLDSNNQESLEEMRIKIEKSTKQLEASQKELLVINENLKKASGGKNPCVPKNAAAQAEFFEQTKNLVEAVKPLGNLFQKASATEFKQLFPEGKPACVVSPVDGSLKGAKRLQAETLKECEEYKTSLCSQIINLSNLDKINCPGSINILWAHADRAEGTELVSVPSDIVKNMICESNGLVRENKKTTFDPELRKHSKKYCYLPSAYTCRIRLLEKNNEVEIDSQELKFKGRDGVEVNCLQAARKLAKPHCLDSKRKIFASVDLRIDGRGLDLNALLMQNTFRNFCHTYRLKKVFH